MVTMMMMIINILRVCGIWFGTFMLYWLIGPIFIMTKNNANAIANNYFVEPPEYYSNVQS